MIAVDDLCVYYNLPILHRLGSARTISRKAFLMIVDFSALVFDVLRHEAMLGP